MRLSKGKSSLQRFNEDLLSKKMKYLKEGNVRKVNLRSAYLIVKPLISMFGPKGSLKMLIDASGDIQITNKGFSVLKSLKNDLPLIRYLINLAESQYEIYGDGVKTLVILTLLLIEKAIELQELGIHAQKICEGYNIATKKSLEILWNSAQDYSNEYRKNLIKTVCNNVYSDKTVNFIINSFSEIFKKMDKEGNKPKLDDIYFIKQAGHRLEDSKLLEGLILKRERPNKNFYTNYKNLKVLIIKRTFDFFAKDNLAIDKEFLVENIEAYNSILDIKQNFYDKIINKLKRYGIKLIFCQKRIDNDFINALAENGIISYELIDQNIIKTLMKLTKANLISNFNNFSEKDIGFVQDLKFRIEEIKKDRLYLKNQDSNIFTFLLRGMNVKILNDFIETIKTIFKVLGNTKRILPGAGAIELEIAAILKKYALNFSGKEQLAILNYAKTFENIPAYLIKNSGGSVFDSALKLRSIHANSEINEVNNIGYDCIENNICDSFTSGILDSYNIKRQIIIASNEAAQQIIRIDGMVICSKIEEKKLEKSRQQEIGDIRKKDITKFFKKEEDLFDL
jgi:chaperonin GroEL (HSP60 family)